MSEKEKEMREMVETLRKLPDHAQEKIGYMIEGAPLTRTSRRRTAVRREARRQA